MSYGAPCSSQIVFACSGGCDSIWFSTVIDEAKQPPESFLKRYAPPLPFPSFRVIIANMKSSRT